MASGRYTSDLTDRQWEHLAPLLRFQRRSKWPLREVVNAIRYVLKNGSGWRDVPRDFPPFPTVYYYFAKSVLGFARPYQLGPCACDRAGTGEKRAIDELVWGSYTTQTVADVYQPLTDCQLQVITSLGILPHASRQRRHCLRHVVAAIWYVCRTGCQWRALPPNYPPWPVVYYYFRRWQEQAVWQRLNIALNERDRQREKRAPEPAMLCVDAQSVKLLPCIVEGRGLDGGKLVNGRKRHIAVDTGGRIWCAHVTAANVADSVDGEEPVATFPRQRLEKGLTDAGYRGAFAQAVEARQLTFEVASRPPTEQGFVPVAFRWVVERTFSWLTWYRRLVHDYDFTTKSHETWLLLANCSLCLSRLAPLATKS